MSEDLKCSDAYKKSTRAAWLIVGSVYLAAGLICLFPQAAPGLALMPLPLWIIVVPMILLS